jgi:hypothetical protein
MQQSSIKLALVQMITLVVQIASAAENEVLLPEQDCLGQYSLPLQE